MGFRDLNTFNLAMLAKQAWRLIHESHSLFYRVYKAQYFPSCSFMDAELRSNPSYVWRSLLQTRDLIWEGSIWQVGDEEQIGIESHKWLPRPPCFHPGVDKSLKVSSLLNATTQQWDRAKIQSLFHDSTRSDIFLLKLGPPRSRDKLCWNENKSKTFLVRTAYQITVKLLNPPSGEHSNARQDVRMWKTLWSLNTPPKVRNFIWRASSDILPTRVNLLCRKIQVDPRCTLCGQHDETTTHILWDCLFARNVWALVRGKLQKSRSGVLSFYELAQMMMTRLTTSELETWAMVSWSIWNARNKFHFEQVQTPPCVIFKGASSLLEEYKRLTGASSNR